MNIPLEVVKRGEKAINEYVELMNKKDDLYEKHSEASRHFKNQLNNIFKEVKEYENSYMYTGTPYYSEDKQKWVIPDIKKLSKTTDAIWTFQRNMELSLNEFINATYEFIKVKEKLSELE